MVAANARGWEVAGTELGAEVAALARKRTGANVRAVDLMVEQAFEEGQFDAITLWGVLEHIATPEQLIKRVVSLLRPGGALLFETPNVLGAFRRAAWHLLRGSGNRIRRPLLETLGAGHVCWFTPSTVVALANRFHLQVENLAGSRNSTRILMSRFIDLPVAKRWSMQAATAAVNTVAAPIGVPNQIIGTLRRS
jgi:2-polyprenyl-3-methyl-5-hydroxy-6-metoxy-1,4-benzoquinol methylase